MVILLPSLLSTGIACVDHHASLVSFYMVLLFTVCGVFLESDGDEAHSRNCWGSDLVHCFLPNSLSTVQEDSQCPPSGMIGQGQKSALPGQVSENCPWPELPTLCIIRMPYWPRAWPWIFDGSPVQCSETLLAGAPQGNTPHRESLAVYKQCPLTVTRFLSPTLLNSVPFGRTKQPGQGSLGPKAGQHSQVCLAAFR